jgi:glycerol-3-phosphate acyltransferase PlsY
MTPAALATLLVAGGYLAGAIPFGVLFARARGVDLRAVGSGNIGATNAARALGKKVGVLVFLCDAAKGLLPVLLARHLAAGRSDGEWLVAGVGAAAFLGHLYPVWLRFRGGKGVATAFGVFLAISPSAALIAFAIFAALYAAWRVSSIGSLAAATVFVPSLWALGAPTADIALAAFMWALIVWKHRGNIGRILRRSESRV